MLVPPLGGALTKSGDGTVVINNLLNQGGGTLNITAGVVAGHGHIGGDVDNSGGTISPGGAAGISGVPEPATCTLLMFGVLATAYYLVGRR